MIKPKTKNILKNNCRAYKDSLFDIKYFIKPYSTHITTFLSFFKVEKLFQRDNHTKKQQLENKHFIALTFILQDLCILWAVPKTVSIPKFSLRRVQLSLVVLQC